MYMHLVPCFCQLVYGCNIHINTYSHEDKKKLNSIFTYWYDICKYKQNEHIFAN